MTMRIMVMTEDSDDDYDDDDYEDNGDDGMAMKIWL